MNLGENNGNGDGQSWKVGAAGGNENMGLAAKASADNSNVKESGLAMTDNSFNGGEYWDTQGNNDQKSDGMLG